MQLPYLFGSVDLSLSLSLYSAHSFNKVGGIVAKRAVLVVEHEGNDKKSLHLPLPEYCQCLSSGPAQHRSKLDSAAVLWLNAIPCSPRSRTESLLIVVSVTAQSKILAVMMTNS